MALPMPEFAMVLDLETCSELDLKSAGAQRYARHPSTQVIVARYRMLARETPGQHDWAPDPTYPTPGNIAIPGGIQGRPALRTVGRIAHGQCWVVAHNAAFERAIWQHILTPRLGWPRCPPPENFIDTMAGALYFGLPAGLEEASRVLGLPHQKDMAGHRLMLQMARPRRKDADGKPVWWHDEDPDKLVRLVEYCGRDVEATVDLFKRLPIIPEREHRIWCMDQRINERGIGVDLELVDKMTALSKRAMAELDEKCHDLTDGRVSRLSEVKKLTDELRQLAPNAGISSLARDQLEALLDDVARPLPPKAQDLINLRLAAARSSVAKLTKMRAYADGDGTARGILQHYGANRTGRWAGRGPQPHNNPRPEKGLDVDSAIGMILADAPPQALDVFLGFDAMTVLSGCLRGCYVPLPGADKALVVADYSQIEARAGAALADEKSILEVFARDEDLYIATAAALGSDVRQFGKLMALSCQYQTGGPKLQYTAKRDYGILLTDAEAATAVYDWREARPNIVKSWWALDDTAKLALRYQNHWHEARNPSGGIMCWFRFERGNLYMRLLSGRCLCYQQAKIRRHPLYGKDSVTYMGVDQTTRKWARVFAYGGMWFNNLVQASSRDVMADCMLDVEHGNVVPGLELLLTVHDELIGQADRDKADAALAGLLARMKKGSDWLPGLVLKAEGYVAPRFKKG